MKVYLAVELTDTSGPRKTFEQVAEALEEEVERILLEVQGGSDMTMADIRVVGVGRTRAELHESEINRGRMKKAR